MCFPPRILVSVQERRARDSMPATFVGCFYLEGILTSKDFELQIELLDQCFPLAHNPT